MSGFYGTSAQKKLFSFESYEMGRVFSPESVPCHLRRDGLYCGLTLKAPTRLQQTTFINIFSLFFRKIRLDVSSESSAWQRIHLKHQALFSSKDNSKKLKCRLLQFLFGALRVNFIIHCHYDM